MPFADQQPQALLGNPYREPDRSVEVEPDFFTETVPAAIRTENTIGSHIANEGRDPRSLPEAGYDPFEDIEGYEDQARAFVAARDAADVARIKRNIDREREDRATLAASGWIGFAATLAAGTLDPVILLPVGGQALKLKQGASVLQRGYETARAGFLGSTSAEALLHSSQETRTFGESAVNVSGATFLSGLLGVVAPSILKSLRRGGETVAQTYGRLAKRVEDDLAAPPVSAPDNFEPGSVLGSRGALAGDVDDITRAPSADLAERLPPDAPATDRFVDGAFRPVGEIKEFYQLHARGATEVSSATPNPIFEIGELPTDTIEEAVRFVPAFSDAPPTARISGRNIVRTEVARPNIAERIIEDVETIVVGGPHEVLPNPRNPDRVLLIGPSARRGREFVTVTEVAPNGTGIDVISIHTAPERTLRQGRELKAQMEEAAGGRDSSRLEDGGGPEPTSPHTVGSKDPHAAADFPRVRPRSEDIGPDDVNVNDLDDFERTRAAEDEGGSVGAAAVRSTTLAEETLKSALGLEKGIAFASPILRATTSPSIATRRTAQSLVETPFFFEKNALGLASDIAVESRVKLWDAPLGESIEEMDRLFVKYRTGRAKGGQFSRAGILARDLTGAASREGKLTHAQFKDAVGHAMRRGDKHNIPEVAEAARFYRAKLFDPLKDKAIESGLLPDDVQVETAVSYLTRVWKVDEINARRPELIDRTVFWLGQTQTDLEEGELIEIADQIIDSILSVPGGRIPYEAVPLARGPLRERTFAIPDDMVEDFLESDIELVARFYTRTMAPDVELTERFGRADMRDAIEKIRDDYNRKFDNAKTDLDRRKLSQRRNNDIRDIEAMRDRLRHKFSAPADPNSPFVRANKVARQANFLRLLGGMTISALPDLARPIMTHGVVRVFGNGLLPLIKNFPRFRLAADEVKMAGTAWDMVLDSRAVSLADVGDDFGRNSKFERGLQALTNNFGLVSLMAPWNAALKQFTGVVTQTRILQAATNRSDVEKLAQSGIDRMMAHRIAEQFKQFGSADGHVALSNAHLWTDAEAVTAFRAAVQKDVDATIVTPGVGDRPLWMSNEVGKTIGQFRSFAVSSAQRVALSGLQQRDMAALNGTILSIGLGMMVYATKTLQAGRDLHDTENVAAWVAEGIDRSGVTGWFFDINNIIEKGTRGTVGVSAVTGGPTMSRYTSRNLTGAVLGPSVGLLEDAATVAGSISAGDFNMHDVRRIRRLLPYQNLFYMRSLFDQAEEGAREALGVQ